jgi:hypothetical protein
MGTAVQVVKWWWIAIGIMTLGTVILGTLVMAEGWPADSSGVLELCCVALGLFTLIGAAIGIVVTLIVGAIGLISRSPPSQEPRDVAKIAEKKPLPRPDWVEHER